MESVAEHYMCHFDPDLVGREILYGSSLMPITGKLQWIHIPNTAPVVQDG
ncbi:MAG: hypothetical protein M1469_01600 [Bacteroidetes bacterium]|nr:hypothetical protein [Bacteroidota bacterium]